MSNDPSLNKMAIAGNHEVEEKAEEEEEEE